MESSQNFDAFPESVPSSSAAGAPAYRRVPGMFAAHGEAAPAGEPAYELPGEGVRVYRGAPPAAAGPTLTPVYALGAGPPAVPTGLVLVRFAEGVRFGSRAAPLREAGFEPVEALSYAP